MAHYQEIADALRQERMAALPIIAPQEQINEEQAAAERRARIRKAATVATYAVGIAANLYVAGVIASVLIGGM